IVRSGQGEPQGAVAETAAEFEDFFGPGDLDELVEEPSHQGPDGRKTALLRQFFQLGKKLVSGRSDLMEIGIDFRGRKIHRIKIVPVPRKSNVKKSPRCQNPGSP